MATSVATLETALRQATEAAQALVKERDRTAEALRAENEQLKPELERERAKVKVAWDDLAEERKTLDERENALEEGELALKTQRLRAAKNMGRAAKSIEEMAQQQRRLARLSKAGCSSTNSSSATVTSDSADGYSARRIVKRKLPSGSQAGPTESDSVAAPLVDPLFDSDSDSDDGAPNQHPTCVSLKVVRLCRSPLEEVWIADVEPAAEETTERQDHGKKKQSRRVKDLARFERATSAWGSHGEPFRPRSLLGDVRASIRATTDVLENEPWIQKGASQPNGLLNPIRDVIGIEKKGADVGVTERCSLYGSEDECIVDAELAATEETTEMKQKGNSHIGQRMDRARFERATSACMKLNCVMGSSGEPFRFRSLLGVMRASVSEFKRTGEGRTIGKFDLGDQSDA
ncbi:hypothetical protein DFH07DRAFT_943080 [Mycena maculata]|uniref:Uncharacterized protein n=1 Tax=Mycena maculata TaxID=230809 RepID=A0AAD7IIS7_9AGAR|nr:hypothetical protein DFH07DRAFT_943080 [Mycena maculata]